MDVVEILLAHSARARLLDATESLRDAVPRLRRIYATLLVEAAPEGRVLGAKSLACDASRIMAGIHPLDAWRRKMLKLADKPRPDLAEPDVDSLMDLVA